MTTEGLKSVPCAKVALEEIPDNLALFKDLFGGKEVRRQFSILNPEYTAEAAGKVSELYRMLMKGIEENSNLPEAKKKEFEEKSPSL